MDFDIEEKKFEKPKREVGVLVKVGWDSRQGGLI